MQLFNNIRELMAYTLENHKKKTAFVIKVKDGEYEEKSYEQMYRDVLALACYIADKGLYKKPVALIGNNCYEWCVALYGILYAGAIAVPLDNKLPQQEVEGLLTRSDAKAVIYTKNHQETIEKLDIPTKILIGGTDANSFCEVLRESGNLPEKFEPIDENELAILMFTSGTTSASKGVLLTQRNLLSNTRDLCDVVDFSKNHTYLSVIPLHHSFGIGATTLFVANGVKTVFPEGLRVAQALTEYNVTLLVLVPAILNLMYKKVQREIEKKGKTKTVNIAIKVSRALRKIGIDVRRKLFKDILEGLGPSVRLIISGASALDGKVNEFFNDIGIDLIQGYGLSETAPVVSAERVGRQKTGSVGYPMASNIVEIHEPDEKGIGEIIVKGPNVFLGYFENAEETEKVLKDGWFFTGDMGYIDDDGFIFITGRKKNVIVLANGKNVFPEELEQKIDELNGVKENIVFLKEANEKEMLCARIVYDTSVFEDKATAERELGQQIQTLNQSLVTYKQIKKISLTDEAMEKTTTAKIKRAEELKKEI